MNKDKPTSAKTEWIAVLAQGTKRVKMAFRSPKLMAVNLQDQTKAGRVVTEVTERPRKTYAGC